MGWIRNKITYYKPNGSPDLIMESFGGDLRWQIDGGSTYEVLKASVVGTRVYAALKISGHGEKPLVRAVVNLTSKQGDYIFIKQQLETVGPCDYDCPPSILNLLTPVNDKDAQEWRLKCKEKTDRKNILRKLAPGSRIKYAPGTEFCRILILERYKNRKYWVLESDRSVYIKTNSILLNGFKVLEERYHENKM